MDVTTNVSSYPRHIKNVSLVDKKFNALFKLRMWCPSCDGTMNSAVYFRPCGLACQYTCNGVKQKHQHHTKTHVVNMPIPDGREQVVVRSFNVSFVVADS